jgi:hypothetical protein
MDENDLMSNQQQYNRMAMQMSSHPGQSQMQYGQSNSYNNFGYSQAYSSHMNQQMMDASSGYGQNQHLSSSSPSMMNPMLHHNMSSHQMQQMQHNYYIPSSNQSYNN